MDENKETIENLDRGMILQVTCRVSCHGIEALRAGRVGTFYKGLLENQHAYN